MNAVKKASKTEGFIGLQRFSRHGERGRGCDAAETLVLPYVQPIKGGALVLEQAELSVAGPIRVNITTENMRPGFVADFSDNVGMRRRKNLE